MASLGQLHNGQIVQCELKSKTNTEHKSICRHSRTQLLAQRPFNKTIEWASREQTNHLLRRSIDCTCWARNGQ